VMCIDEAQRLITSHCSYWLHVCLSFCQSLRMIHLIYILNRLCYSVDNW